jgi:DNA-binding CsgD family transcriptional regulator
MRIPSELLSRLSSAILRLYAPATPDEIPARFFSVIRDLMACEHLSYNEFRVNHISSFLDPVIDPALGEAWDALVDQHPVINHITRTNTLSAIKISDCLTSQQWRRTGLFNEVFAKLQIEHQMGFMFSMGNAKIGFAANRSGRDFSEVHRFILSFLAPHLSQAIQNAVAMERQQERMHLVADVPGGGGVIVFNGEGALLFCSRKAADCLGRFFGPVTADQLPDELSRWLQRALRRPTLDDLSAGALHPFTKQGASSSLTVRLMPNPATNEHVLVLEEQSTDLPYSSLKYFGLTRRETEVLNWVTQGKTNPEIAIILNISVKTVGHHIEHIMSKLGVERRGGAALWAQQTLALCL